MKRVVICVVVAVLSAAAVSACGEQGTPTESEEEPRPKLLKPTAEAEKLSNKAGAYCGRVKNGRTGPGEEAQMKQDVARFIIEYKQMTRQAKHDGIPTDRMDRRWDELAYSGYLYLNRCDPDNAARLKKLSDSLKTSFDGPPQ